MATRPYAKEFAIGNSVAQLSLGLATGETLQIASATVSNGNGTIQHVTINLASDGSAASATNLIEPSQPINPNRSAGTVLSGKTVLAGGKVYAGADTATAMAMQISGTVIA